MLLDLGLSGSRFRIVLCFINVFITTVELCIVLTAEIFNESVSVSRQLVLNDSNVSTITDSREADSVSIQQSLLAAMRNYYAYVFVLTISSLDSIL